MKKHITIVEDNLSYAQTLQKIIGQEKDMICEVVFPNGTGAIDSLEDLSPNVCLLDIQLPDMTGIDVLQRIKVKCPTTIFIMCTVYDDDEHLFQSLKAGADGYILKSDSPIQIIEAIRNALGGSAPMSASIAKKVVGFFYQQSQKKNRLEQLSDKENEVLDLLSQGLLYKEIADRQNVTIDTIKKHCGSIYRKLQVCNRTEALNLFFNQ